MKFPYTALILLFGLIDFAQALGGDPTFAQIQTYLSQHPNASMEEFLLSLPEDYRTHFTLMKDSPSEQGGTPTFPRAILFGRTGKQILAFRGDPSDEQYLNLESITFNETTKKPEFREIRFPKDKESKVEITKANPEKCTTCHGANPNYTWAPYSVWEHAFGSDDDFLPSDSQERKQFEAFWQNQGKSGRYATLVRDPENPFYPYRPNAKSRRIDDMANTRLTKLVGRLSVLNFAHTLQQSKLYPKYAEVLMAQLLECNMDRVAPLVERAMREDQKRVGVDNLPSSTDTFYRPLSNTLKLLGSENSAGISPNTGPLSVKTPAPAELVSLSYFEGGHDVRKMLVSVLFPEVARHSNGLAGMKFSTGILNSSEYRNYSEELRRRNVSFEFVKSLDTILPILEIPPKTPCPILMDIIERKFSLKPHKARTSGH